MKNMKITALKRSHRLALLACIIGAQLIGPWLTGEALAMNMRRAPFHYAAQLRAMSQHPAWRTLAGCPNATGTNDGPGISARFWNPSGIAVDATGIIYVADPGNGVIRRISPAGLVSTVAGKPGQLGWQDGPAAIARFSSLTALAVDAEGSLFMADNCAIRQLSAAGVVTTTAGRPGVNGYADGTGTNALFGYSIGGLARDTNGTLYVADPNNGCIRKVSAGGAVSTLAGQADKSGHQDGIGTNALFVNIRGLALDSSGNLYVADWGTIRKITPTGLVTTWVGSPHMWGYRDEKGTNAWFDGLSGLGIDSHDNLYVTEYNNRCIRKVSPGGEVSTLGGDAWVSSSPLHRDGLGPFATFNSPQAIALDPSGHLLVVDSDNTVRYGSVGPETQPEMLAQPRSRTVQEGANVTFSVVAQSTAPLTYQWLLNGQLIHNATNASLAVEKVTPEAAGEYLVAVSDGVGYVLSFPAALQVTSSATASRSPLEDWRPLASLPLQDMRGLAFGNGRYVAVGGGFELGWEPPPELRGSVATSPDGEHWVKQFPITSESLNSVAFGNGRFVIVGNNGKVFTSTAGLEWETQTLTAVGRPNLRGVVFDQGLFVTVSGDANGSIWTSPDGSNWTNRGVDFGVSFMAIGVGGGKFIAVGNTIMVSTNGLNWEPVEVTTNYFELEIVLDHIAGGNGLFLASGGVSADSRNVLAASATGQEWQDITATNELSLCQVTCGNGCFAAVDANSGGICVSTDGRAWTAPVIISSGGRTWSAPHLCFENGHFVASGDYGLLATSSDGTSWPSHQQQQAIPFIPSKIINVAGRYFAAGGASAVATSTNGSDWEVLFTPTSANSLVYGDGTLVTVGGGDQIASSHDGGVTWTDRSPHLHYGTRTPSLNRISYGGGVFVAVGSLSTSGLFQVNQGHILASSNLVNWVATDLPPTNSISDVTFGGGVFVALLSMWSGETQILTSTNGFSWKTATSLPDADLYHAAYGNGKFVLAGSGAEVISSPDGINWHRHPVPAANYFNEVVFGNELFVGIANAGLRSSADGITWTQCAAPGYYQRVLRVSL